MREKDTNSKKRLIITITSLCIAIIAVLASIVAIFAAANQSVTSQFQVEYVANNVNAKISATYQLQTVSRTNGAATAYVAHGDEKNLAEAVSFTADEATQIKEINKIDTAETPDEDKLLFTATESAIVFKFTFENTSQSTPFTVTLADGAMTNKTGTPKTENVYAEYAWEVKDDEEPLAYKDSLVPTAAAASQWSIDVEAGQTVEVYIRVTIENVANVARYVSNEAGHITWSLVSGRNTNV